MDVQIVVTTKQLVPQLCSSRSITVDITKFDEISLIVYSKVLNFEILKF